MIEGTRGIKEYVFALKSVISTFGFLGVAKKSWSIYQNEGISGIRRRLNYVVNASGSQSVHMKSLGSLYPVELPPKMAPSSEPLSPVQETVKDILTFQTDHLYASAELPEQPPMISVIVGIYKTPLHMLKQAIDSIIHQTRSDWELILVDDCSNNQQIADLIMQYHDADKRVKCFFRSQNGNISEANNTGLEYATASFYTILDHDDALHPEAFYHVSTAIAENADVDYIYSDEDKLTEDGKSCFGPFFKPDWSPEYIIAMMYTCHMSIFRTELVKSIGGYNSKFDGAQDYDLALRVVNRTKNIIHLPMVLYHWRVWENSTASSIDAKPDSLERARKAIIDHLDYKHDNYSITDAVIRGHFRVDFYPKEESLVSIVIPTANGDMEINGQIERHINAVCEGILEKTEYKNYEIVVVHNGDLDDGQLTWFNSMDNVKLCHYQSEEFSLAEKINQGAAAAAGEYLVIMNDDIRVISPDWLTQMLGMVQREGVGVVGPKLLFPDNTIQHAGVVLLGGLPGHAYYQYPSDAHGYGLGAAVNRNYSAVTGACAITPTKLYNELGGYSSRYPLNYNDVDYCLRAAALGYRSVYLANVELYHYEGVSKDGGRSVGDTEIDKFLEDWSDKMKFDPYYNPTLSQLRPYE